MKKKLLSVLFSGALAFGVFALPGNAAKAEEEPCDCHSWVPISGAERNVNVAGLLSSQVFKDVKADLWKKGYSWNGAHSIEVINPFDGLVMIGIPFVKADGTIEYHVFINGVYKGATPQ
ncbi:hypothetical protein DRW41_04085 [Neobacillus piezotolerans]|uniref:Lipoprotein n=1 Tax=Neobacillus piezotolerans TaxID=2259171 RepID=A0A3D8GWB4_9BACI|nr:hypothetical protein [Neobacillus piezotolerans]RDU38747.1 hypothetical protein DRW41_04085 [Neobacillus piezotolerans]